MTLLALIAALAFLTGVTSKFADLLNEHGFRWFPGAGWVSGLAWASLATGLTVLDPWVAALWMGTVLFWFLRCKLDRFNHAFAGVGVVIAATYLATQDSFPLFPAVGIFAWLTLSGEVQNLLKSRFAENRILQRVLRLRLRYYAGPVVLAYLGDSWLPIVAIAAGMLGTELITRWHTVVARRRRDADLLWGMSYTVSEDQGGFGTAVPTHRLQTPKEAPAVSVSSRGGR